MRRLVSLAMLLIAASVGCEEATDPPVAPATSPSGDAPSSASSASTADVVSSSRIRRPAIIDVDDEAPERAGLPLPRPTAFDLVGAPAGAVLIWATDDAVRAARLSAQGEIRHQTEVARARGVTELAAAATSDRVATIWIAGDATLGAANGTLPELAFGPARPMGETDPAGPAGGRLRATATATGEVMALARTVDEPCERYDEPTCANFTMLDLVQARARRRPGLEVPHPCQHPVAGFAVAGVHWHYAVCHHDGPTPTTVLFTAQQKPSYAQTQELLTGCTPRGLTRRGDDIWLSGICSGDQRAVHVRKLDVTLGASSTRDEVTCRDDELIVQLDGDEVKLDASTVGLGALLPAHLVPADARAVWTGEALLVAQAADGRLEIARHHCRAGALHREGS